MSSDKKRKYHRLLKRQLNKVEQLNTEDPAVIKLLNLVENAYQSFEEDIKHSERILDQSSNELFIANKELQHHAELKSQEAQESNTRLKEVIDSINEVVFRAGKDLKISMINPAWEKITGYTVKETENTDLSSYFSPESVKALSALFHNSDSNTFSETLQIQTKKGENRFVKVLVSKQDKLGRQFYAGTISDIHDQVLNQKELERLALIAQRTKNVIVLTDLEGKITWVNNAFESLSGYSLKEVMGSRPGDVLQGEKTDRETTKDISEHLRSNKSYQGEIYNYAKDGRGYWLELYIDPYYDDNGQLIGYIAIENEITEKRQQREDLRESEAKLSAVINSIPDLISYKNLKGEYELGNEAFYRLANVTAETLAGSRDAQIFSKEVAEEIAVADSIALKYGFAEAKEEQVPFPDGSERILETRKTVVKDKNQTPIGIVGVGRDVTEIRAAERKIRESQERLTLATNAMHLGIWDWNIERNDLIWDDSMYLLFEISPTKFSGAYKAFESALHPEDKERVWSEVEACIQEQKDFDSNFRIIGRKENVKHIKATAKLIKSEDGTGNRLIGINYDITKEVYAKQRIDQLVEWLNESSEAVQVSNEAGELVFVNHEAARRLGASREELTGKYIGEIEKLFQKKEDWKKHVEEMKQKGSMLTTGYHKKKNGQTFPVEASVKYHVSSGGKGFILAFIRDISERVQYEQKLKASSKALEEAQEIAKVGGWEVNLIDNTVSYTRETYRILGEDTDNYIPSIEKGLKFYTPESRQEIEQALKRAIHDGKDFDLEGKLKTKQGDLKVVRIRGVSEVKNGKTERITGIFQDITNEKEAEEKLKSYASELESINQDLDQFAYAVSHDLKAPLRAINNLSEWIEEDLEQVLEGDTKEQFSLLRGRVQRMELLINGILQYSRAGRAKANLTNIKLKPFVEDICDSLKHSNNIQYTIQGENFELQTDKVALEQVVSNFVSNGIKYNDKEIAEVGIRWHQTADMLEFSISDNGPGIEEQYHEKIFVMFQTLQARDVIESTGVGLAIVKKLIKDKGGDIRVDSKLGEGTTFTFTWPLEVNQDGY